MFSKNSHGYRAHAHTVRVKDLLFHLYYLYVYVFGQWTVMDSSFLKSLTGTARTCGTRDKFRNFTVHYCPLSRYNQISVTPVTPDFLKVSRVLRTRIMRTGVTRTHLHGTREKFTHYNVTGVTVHLWVGKAPPQHRDDLVIYTKILNSLSARACSLATEGTQEPSPVSFLYRM